MARWEWGWQDLWDLFGGGGEVSSKFGRQSMSQNGLLRSREANPEQRTKKRTGFLPSCASSGGKSPRVLRST